MEKEKYTKSKIVDSIVGLLIKNPKLTDKIMGERSHFDRDLKLNNDEIKNLVTDLEKKFKIRITSNVTVFAREIGQLAFYIENQLRGDQ